MTDLNYTPEEVKAYMDGYEDGVQKGMEMMEKTMGVWFRANLSKPCPQS